MLKPLVAGINAALVVGCVKSTIKVDDAPAPPAGWSPADLDLSFWYDPSDLSSLFQDAAGTIPVTGDNQPVGLMLDKSGNGRHASQTTAAARPIYRNVGGLHYLAFDGIDDRLVCDAELVRDGVNLSRAFTVGFEHVPATGYYPIYAVATGSLSRYLARYNPNGATSWEFTLLQGQRSVSAAGEIKANINVTAVGTSQKALVNGRVDSYNSAADDTVTLKLLGALLSGGNPALFDNFNFYGFFAYSGITAADRDAYTTATEANNWMNSKTGAE